MNRTNRPVRSRRAAFTLVEVLLSAGLMLLVVGAAYAAIDLFRRTTIAGRAEAERSQILRALEWRIRSDLRAVMFRVPPPVDPATGTETAGAAAIDFNVGAASDPAADSTTTTSSTTTTTSTEPVAPVPAYGLFGEPAKLTMHVSHPERAIGLPAAQAGLDPTAAPLTVSYGDLKSVSYFLAAAGGGGLEGAVGDAAAGGNAFGAVRGSQGLARLEGDGVAMTAADAAGDVAFLASQTVVLAEEVTSLQFRYFDGLNWYDTWDSSASLMLPRAIEVTITLMVDPIDRPAPDGAQPADPYAVRRDPTAMPPRIIMHRFVVALPASDPAPPATL